MKRVNLLFCDIRGFRCFLACFLFFLGLLFLFIPTLLLCEACNFTTDYCYCFMGVVFSRRMIALAAVLSSCNLEL
jgi:hypothetical protein